MVAAKRWGGEKEKEKLRAFRTMEEVTWRRVSKEMTQKSPASLASMGTTAGEGRRKLVAMRFLNNTPG